MAVGLWNSCLISILVTQRYWFLSLQIRSNMLIIINCFETSMPYAVIKDGDDKDDKNDAIEVAILKLTL